MSMNTNVSDDLAIMLKHACRRHTCDVKLYDFTALTSGLAKHDLNVCMYTFPMCAIESLEPLLVQNANSSFQSKPRKIFNDIKR